MTPLPPSDARDEVRALDALGCTNSRDLVLSAGVSRCRQVRHWIERLQREGEVLNPAALASSTILRKRYTPAPKRQ